ncbi:MAG: hypothetical protein JST51_12410 [Armatimonadetes bacterium]|nr:hypothetical protein [Armatimonadota bacterium]
MMTLFVMAQLASTMPFLSPVFGDHMVLQRDKVNELWGWTQPNASVSLTINPDKGGVRTVTAMGKADANGKWTLRFRPPVTGGPYTVKIQGGQTVELHDVLVGDVWICSGQSNMEFGITMANNAKEEIQNANRPTIRLYAVPKSPSNTLRPFVESQWLACTPENIVKGGWGGFTAVGYFFGRKLNDDLKVPIGLIHTSWGGTPAESWTSAKGIIKDFQKQVDAVEAMNEPGAPHTADLVEQWAKASGPDYSGADVDDSAWDSVDLPARFGRIGLANLRGAVWFRKTVDLPDPLPDGDAQLTTGSNDGIDLNFVNGVRTDFGSSVLNWRNHAVPRSALHPGKNVISICFTGMSGGAGFTTGADAFNLRIGGKWFPLGGPWKMKKAFELKDVAPVPPLVENNPYWPTTLYNGMLYPLMPMAIKGAIWYQGESNVGRAEQYSRLLPAMITDWRKGFGQGDFPFFVVQLANFGGRSAQPHDAGWPELREAQTKAVNSVKNAGLAVSVDIGEARDIHPKNKQEVGRRLALSALKTAYGKKLEDSGPTFAEANSKGDGKLVVWFHHAKGLVLRPGATSGFAICGKDGKFVWADAKVVGESVVLTSPEVANPVDVRYAWDDDPVATLYNGDGLPAVPFRTR